VPLGRYAVDASRGALLWTARIGSASGCTPPTVANGFVYVGSGDWSVYAVATEPATGAERAVERAYAWKYTTGGTVLSQPAWAAAATAGGAVFAGSEDGFMYALDGATGAKLWAFGTSDQALSSPWLADGLVFFGSGKAVYALIAASGERRLTFPTNGTMIAAPVVDEGVVYIGSTGSSTKGNYMYAIHVRASGTKLSESGLHF